jgi:cell shape-determining protein MreC
MTLNSSFIRKKLLINDKRVQIDIFRGLAITQVIFFHSIIGFSSLSQRNDQNILSITVSLGEYFKFGPFIFFVRKKEKKKKRKRRKRKKRKNKEKRKKKKRKKKKKKEKKKVGTLCYFVLCVTFVLFLSQKFKARDFPDISH